MSGKRHTAIVQFAVSLIEALYDSQTIAWAAAAVTAVGWVLIVPWSQKVLVLEDCESGNKWNIIMTEYYNDYDDRIRSLNFVHRGLKVAHSKIVRFGLSIDVKLNTAKFQDISPKLYLSPNFIS